MKLSKEQVAAIDSYIKAIEDHEVTVTFKLGDLVIFAGVMTQLNNSGLIGALVPLDGRNAERFDNAGRLLHGAGRRIMRDAERAVLGYELPNMNSASA
jgi:hypothetical protein